MKTKEREYDCLMDMAVHFIGGRYKAVILWRLSFGTLRCSQLQRLIPKATPKVLTGQLRDLEADGLIARTVYPEVPVRVEYSLTEFGRTLAPILDAMCEWGKVYLQKTGQEGAEDGDDCADRATCAAADAAGGPCRPAGDAVR